MGSGISWRFYLCPGILIYFGQIQHCLSSVKSSLKENWMRCTWTVQLFMKGAMYEVLLSSLNKESTFLNIKPQQQPRRQLRQQQRRQYSCEEDDLCQMTRGIIYWTEREHGEKIKSISSELRDIGHTGRTSTVLRPG